MRYLEKKVPPLFVLLIVGAIMRLWRGKHTLPKVRQFAPLSFLGGLVLIGSAVFRFGQQQTTVNPHHPEKTSALVDTGVYRYTRNPMYLGMLFLLTSWCMRLSSMSSIMALPLFTLYIQRFQILPEERILQQQFGSDYTHYKKRVRRWL